MSDDQSDLASLDGRTLLTQYRTRNLSPVEVHDAVVARIERSEPTLNAFWQRDEHSSRQAARQSEKRWRAGEPAGPLDGLPITLKENVARVGVPMPSGCAGVEPKIPTQDAPITARVSETGAVVLGSTVMPDWGMLSSGVSSLHGITRSPWNPDWTTGGSSGGAGAAAAAGYGPLHVGTDIGGSIRLPGTWLGLASLKPSYGRVPLDVPYQGRAAGPLARTMSDVCLLMGVIAQYDPRDFTALPPDERAWPSERGDVAGLRIGLQLDAGCGGSVDHEVADAIREVAATFAAGGARVVDVEPFMTQELLDALNLFWQVRSWTDYHTLDAEHRAKVLPFVADWCSRGADVSGRVVHQCITKILEIQQRTVSTTEQFDLVLSPVAPVAAFDAEQPMPYADPDHAMDHIGFTAPYNMSGQPAATINCGFTADGRPIGVQIAGPRFSDREVLAAAWWYEQARPAHAVPKWPSP